MVLNGLSEEFNIQDLLHSWRWWHLFGSQPDGLKHFENVTLTEL